MSMQQILDLYHSDYHVLASHRDGWSPFYRRKLRFRVRRELTMIQFQDWKINLQFQSPGLIPSHSSNTWPGNKSVPGDSSLPGRLGPGGGSAPGSSGHWAAAPGATVRRRGTPVPPPPPPPSTCGAHLALPSAGLASRLPPSLLPPLRSGPPIGCGLRPSDRSPAGPRQAGSPAPQVAVRVVDWPRQLSVRAAGPSRRRGPAVGARPGLAVVSGSAGLAGGRAAGRGGGGA